MSTNHVNRDEKGHVIDLAPFMSKYIDLPSNSNPSKENHDGAFIEVPDDPTNESATIVTRPLPDDLNDEESKGIYDKPLPLDLGEIEEGQKKVIGLDVEDKTGNKVVVPLDVTDSSKDPVLVGLDIGEKKEGDKIIVPLDDVTDKSPDPKIVKLDGIEEKKGKEVIVPLDESAGVTNVVDSVSKKVIQLNTSSKSGSGDLIKLSGTGSTSTGHDGKIIRLEIPENIEKSGTIVALQLTSQKTGETKIVKLEVDKKTKEASIVPLEIPETNGGSKLVSLGIDKKTGEAKLIPLEVEIKNGEQVLVPLEVEYKEGESKLVKLEVEEKEGEAKLVKLDVDPKEGEAVLVPLDVPEKIGEPKLVQLEVPELIGEAVLVKLIVEPKTKDPVLVELIVPELTKDPVLVPLEVDPKTKDPVLVLLQVDPKTKDPMLVMLDVPELIGQVKLVELQVDPKTKAPVLVPLDVPELTKDPVLVPLEVDPKTKDPVLVSLEVEPKTKDPVLVELNVDPKEGEAVLVPLDVPEKTGEPKLVELNVPEKTGEAKLVELDVEEKEGEAKLVPLADNANEDSESELSEYDGESYFPGTTIPVHQKSSGSQVESSASKVTELSSEARQKYEATAAWLGIPGVAGINAAMDYENLMELYDRMGEVGERMKSYLTASMAGSGELSPMISHTLAAPQANPVVRAANYGIREMNETQLMDSVSSATETVGVTKDKIIQKLLKEAVAAYNLGLVATNSDPNRMPGAASNIGSTITGVLGDLTSGNSILGTIKNAATNILAKEDPLNVPKWDGGSVSDRFSTANYSKHVKDPDVYTNKISTIGPGGSTSMDFKYRLGTSQGMMTTITELMSSTADEIDSLSKLREILNTKTGSVITNYKNHLLGGQSTKGIGDIGLDTNSVWEIVLDPLIDDMNGMFTYLPPISYINTYNKDWFNVNTGYTRWLPFTSFELQDKKMTNRSLNLYDGSITYPISIEFVNELRITIADDQLKSFKNYFDTVLKVSAYKSKEYTDATDSSDPEIDETKPMVAMYKNITFECTIYVMNLEMATVKKFPLLVVLRDYIQEYNGDIEPSATDLALQFSIVGELDKDYETFNRSYSEYNFTKDQLNNSYRLENPEGPSTISRVIDSIFN